MNDIQRFITRYLKQTRVQHWILFLIISGLVWTFVPTNIILFVPVVIFWILVTAMLATVLLSWWVDK